MRRPALGGELPNRNRGSYETDESTGTALKYLLAGRRRTSVFCFSAVLLGPNWRASTFGRFC